MDPINLDLPDVDRDYECYLCGEPVVMGMKNAHISISQYSRVGTGPRYRMDDLLLSVLAGPKCTEELEDFADQLSPIQCDNWDARITQAEQCGLCRGEIKDRVRYVGELLIEEEDQQSETWDDISYCKSCVKVTGEFVQNLAKTENE